MTLAIQRERRNIIRPAQALTPAGQDVVVNFIDFAPRATITPELRAGGQPRSTPLPGHPHRRPGRGHADAAALRAGRSRNCWPRGPSAQAPLTLFVGASGLRKEATLQVAGAAPPALSYDLPVMSEAAPGTLTITGPEPLATYVVAAVMDVP